MTISITDFKPKVLDAEVNNKMKIFEWFQHTGK